MSLPLKCPPPKKILRPGAGILVRPKRTACSRSWRIKIVGYRNSSTSLALLYLMHKWYEVMDTANRIIRIIFLDFKKAFDLIDHNILLENMKCISVRMALIKWFTTYLNDMSHYIELGNATSGLRVIREGRRQ